MGWASDLMTTVLPIAASAIHPLYVTYLWGHITKFAVHTGTHFQEGSISAMNLLFPISQESEDLISISSHVIHDFQ